MDILQALKHWLGRGEPDFSQAPITNARAERIQHQIGELERQAVENALNVDRALTARLVKLEARNQNLDAFYVKTVAKAMDERFTTFEKSSMAALNQTSAATNSRIDDLLKMIDSVLDQLRTERARIDAANGSHAKLIARLRAGLGD